LDRWYHHRTLQQQQDFPGRTGKAFDLAKGLSEGYPRDGIIRRYPRLAEAWSQYNQCRLRQLVQREVPKSGGKSVENRIISYPTGYSILPYSGGLLDQPAYLVDVFAQFMQAERVVAMKQLTKG